MYNCLFRCGATICTLFLVSAALGQGTADDRYTNDQSAFRELETRLITVDFKSTAMSDVLHTLQADTGLQFVMNESAADNNMDPDTLIKLQMKDTRFATVLHFMLEPHQCTWTIRDGVVIIISEDAALDTNFLGLMTFNCADVLQNITPDIVQRFNSTRGSRGGGFGGGGGVFSVPDTQDDPEQELVDTGTASEDEKQNPPRPAAPAVIEYTISPADQLKNLIQEAVDPDSWDENGGVGRIVPVNKVFVIRQTQQNLREVHYLLNQLRASGLED